MQFSEKMLLTALDRAQPFGDEDTVPMLKRDVVALIDDVREARQAFTNLRKAVAALGTEVLGMDDFAAHIDGAPPVLECVRTLVPLLNEKIALLESMLKTPRTWADSIRLAAPVDDGAATALRPSDDVPAQQAPAPMPTYQCHKTVQALKIAAVAIYDTDGVEISFMDSWRPAIKVTDEWAKKHNPRHGGYLVFYEDGYMSFSPAKAFEEGYKQIDPGREIKWQYEFGGFWHDIGSGPLPLLKTEHQHGDRREWRLVPA